MCSTSLLLLWNFQCNYYLLLQEPAALQRAFLSSEGISESDLRSLLPRPDSCPCSSSGGRRLAAPVLALRLPHPHTSVGALREDMRHTPTLCFLSGADGMLKCNASQTSACISCPQRAEMTGGLSLTQRPRFRDP